LLVDATAYSDVIDEMIVENYMYFAQGDVFRASLITYVSTPGVLTLKHVSVSASISISIFNHIQISERPLNLAL